MYFQQSSRMTEEREFDMMWHNFPNHLRELMYTMITNPASTDVTLVCDDQTQFRAHKIVLSSCSRLFQRMINNNFNNNGVSNTLIYLKGIKNQEMNALISFMYFGQASLKQERIKHFLNAAKDLEMKDIDSLNGENKGFEMDYSGDIVNKKGEKDEAISCPELDCGKQYSGPASITYLTNHLYKHHKRDMDEVNEIIKKSVESGSTKLVNCPRCDKMFDNKIILSNHIYDHHSNRNDYEKTMDRMTKYPKTVNEDIENSGIQFVQNDNEALKCLECGDKFDNKTDLNSHIEVVHEAIISIETEPPKIADRGKTMVSIMCPQCGNKFVNKTSLKKHIESLHNGMVNIEEVEEIVPVKIMNLDKITCSTCGNKFVNQIALKSHIMNHHQEMEEDMDDPELVSENQQFACSVCQSKFFDESSMKAHKSIAHKELSCHFCDFKTYTNINLLNHRLTVHEQMKCKLCDKKFSDIDSLKHHVLNDHKNDIQNIRNRQKYKVKK